MGGGSRAGVGNTFGGDLAGLAPGRNEAGQSAEEDQMTSWAPNVSGPGGP